MKISSERERESAIDELSVLFPPILPVKCGWNRVGSYITTQTVFCILRI